MGVVLMYIGECGLCPGIPFQKVGGHATSHVRLVDPERFILPFFWNHRQPILA